MSTPSARACRREYPWTPSAFANMLPPAVRLAVQKGQVPVVRDEDVVQDPDAQQLPGLGQAVGHVPILLGCAQVAAGVVVREDDGDTAGEDRRLEDLPGVDGAAVGRADR